MGAPCGTPIIQNSYVSKDELQHVEAAVNKWTERRGHLKNGITVHTAADSMHIPRYMFTA